MKILGLTGQTGAGKTTALQAVEQFFGGVVLDCDGLYATMLHEHIALKSALVQAFQDILDDNGEIDRKKLGNIVFQSTDEMTKLNKITLPIIKKEVEQQIETWRKSGHTMVAIDAILLIESGLSSLCDHTLAVTAPENVRITRIMKRDGISQEYATNRVKSQKSEVFYKENCDYHLENNYIQQEDFAVAVKQLLEGMVNNEEENIMDEINAKERGEALRKALLYKSKHGFDLMTPEEILTMDDYCVGYKQFLDTGKTERECVDRTIAIATAAGFVEYTDGMELKPGAKVYYNNRGKAIILATIGRNSLQKGARIAAAHIDAPRIDLKQIPLYEENELAWFKTHYYGGIRKYQWVAIPLELRGVIALKTGQVVHVAVGDGEGDPIFTITDLLPHLGVDQSKKPLGTAITGEGLNILVGSFPLRGDEGSDRVKLAVLELLNRKYGIIEEDFISAELCAVPAFPARDVGFDCSMIGAYGQDDRVCSYAALMALLQVEFPEHTVVCMLADKEEIGSEGVTGMKSLAFDWFMARLCNTQKVSLDECFANSFCLSADVTAAYDPNFAEVYDKRNSAYLNHGIGLCKYTGSRGKSGASDATAELVGKVRRIFDDNQVLWQMAELGKVDQGGGGTVAAYMAERNIDTLDAGVPVLSMHSPFETVSKLDCYMTFKGIKFIYES